MKSIIILETVKYIIYKNKGVKIMYRYYTITVKTHDDGEVLYQSTLISQKTMLDIVKSFSEDYDDLSIDTIITTKYYTEPRWWVE